MPEDRPAFRLTGTSHASCRTSTTGGLNLSKYGPDPLQRQPGGSVGVVHVRVEFDRDPVVVTDPVERLQRRREIDGPFARDQVVVDATGGNVLQVDVADVPRQTVGGGRR